MTEQEFQSKMLGYIAEIYQKMTDMRSEMKDMRSDISDIKSRTSKIEIKLENDITTKFNMLFEINQQHTEQLNRIEERVTQHEEYHLKRIK